MKKYTIEIGDTLSSIAKKFYNDPTKYKEIAKANNISNSEIIYVGKELIIPDIKDKDSKTTDFISQSNTSSNSDIKKNSSIVFTSDSLALIMPDAKPYNITKYLKALNSEIQKFHINTPLRASHFIAQLAHESGSLKYNAENLNYSAKALRLVFSKYFLTEEQAQEYAHKPEKIANRVYANRMKNGNEESGEGWKFRGRGLIQLTGKDNYQKCGLALKIDLIRNPDLIADDPYAAVAAAGWFWDKRSLNNYADKDDIKTITRRINGGYNGLKDREKYLANAKKVIGL